MEERRQQRCHWWDFITVEPVMFLYMMAFMLTSVVEQAFFVDKACRVNLNFSDTICSNLADKQYKEYNMHVQVRFYQIIAEPKQILMYKSYFICVCEHIMRPNSFVLHMYYHVQLAIWFDAFLASPSGCNHIVSLQSLNCCLLFLS